MSNFKAENISVSVGKKKNIKYLVQDVSLHANAGETVGIVGESGCGKTTFCLALMGLLNPGMNVEGTIELNGESYDLSNMTFKQWKKLRGDEISMIFQDSLASLNPLHKIGKQITEAILVKNKISKKDARARALELLESVDISDPESRFNQYPHQLSGGMRQRVMIAIAIANNPSVLICDEPTTALDVSIQSEIMALLKSLQDKHGMTIIFVSHDLGVINAVSDQTYVMYAGKNIEYGSTQNILNAPTHPYTNALISAMPDLVGDREIKSIEGSPPKLIELFDYCSFGSRCENHQNKCDESMPELTQIGENKDHYCACYYPLLDNTGGEA